MTLESTIEAYLVKRVEALGGFSLKTDTVSGRRFVDRTCFLPGGRVVIIETKRPKGGRRAPHQVENIRRLLEMRHEAAFCKTKYEIDRVLDRRPEWVEGLLLYMTHGKPAMASTPDGLFFVHSYEELRAFKK